jgi:hypothetical protein
MGERNYPMISFIPESRRENLPQLKPYGTTEVAEKYSVSSKKAFFRREDKEGEHLEGTGGE